MTYTQRDLDAILEEEGKIASVRVRLRFPRNFAGGQPAGEKELKAFIQHHLGISPDAPEFMETYARIRREEMGEETTPEGGEVQTEQVYGVNIIRKSDKGPFILEHQIKAWLKTAASRMGIFKTKIGSKGDLAEMGMVTACGDSLQSALRSWEIYLRKDGGPVGTSFVNVSGRVNTPSGAKSIQHHSEVTDEGAVIEFRVSWTKIKFSMEDMLKTLAAASRDRLGSMRSIGYGDIEIISVEAEEAANHVSKKQRKVA